MFRSVKPLESIACVPEPNAVSIRCCGRWQAWSIIVNVDLQYSVLNACADADGAGRHACCDAVANGVLCQRLQDQVGQKGFQGIRLDLHLDGEAIGEAHLLDVEIQLEKIKFFAECDFLAI